MRSMSVRPLLAGDELRWRALFAGYCAFYETELEPAVVELTWCRLLAADAGLHGLVAEAGGGVVGLSHVVVHPSTWSTTPYVYLEDLFVDPAARGTGAGRALIDAVYALADEHGAARVYWHTKHDNATARRLYDRVGALTPFVKYQRL